MKKRNLNQWGVVNEKNAFIDRIAYNPQLMNFFKLLNIQVDLNLITLTSFLILRTE